MLFKRTRFETEMQVRQDEIDMFRHVHSSKYLDYVLHARFDQMERCYGMSMDEFFKMGLGFVVKTSHIEYKRPLVLAEKFTVTTWVEGISGADVEVRFEIRKKETSKPAAAGWCLFTMTQLETGRAATIPNSIIEKYAI